MCVCIYIVYIHTQVRIHETYVYTFASAFTHTTFPHVCHMCHTYFTRVWPHDWYLTATHCSEVVVVGCRVRSSSIRQGDRNTSLLHSFLRPRTHRHQGRAAYCRKRLHSACRTRPPQPAALGGTLNRHAQDQRPLAQDNQWQINTSADGDGSPFSGRL